MKPVTEKRWNYQQYLTLDDDTRYEIIEGELFILLTPNLDHQNISGNLEYALRKYVEEKELGVVFHAPVDVILDEDNVVQPDIIFVSKKNYSILKEKGVFGSPDLVVEIISPTSLRRDRYEKKELYKRFQIKEYWIVDGANKALEVFILKGQDYELLSFASEKGIITSQSIDGFQIELSTLFKSVWK